MDEVADRALWRRRNTGKLETDRPTPRKEKGNAVCSITVVSTLSNGAPPSSDHLKRALEGSQWELLGSLAVHLTV